MFNVTSSNFGEWLSDAGLLESTLDQNGDGWSSWTTSSLTDGETVKKRYLYVSPSCSWSELEIAREAMEANNPSKAYGVVFPTDRAPQLDARNVGRLHDLLPNGHTLTLRLLYYSSVFNRNLRSPTATQVENFVEQRVSFPGISEPVAALTTIVRWLRGEIDTKQRIAVLLAPGGQGKTTLARQIFNHFATAKFEATVPLLVNSDAWNRNAEIITDMEDVWRLGIRECYPDAGVSPDMLQRSLLLGTICPILDGLDELCTVLPWDFKPDETVSALIDTFEGSAGDGRLLITSRLTFWEDNISPSMLNKVLQISLHKFDEQERNDYLQKRFPDGDQKRERAQRILARIATRAGAYRSETGEPLRLTRDQSVKPYEGIEFVPFVVMLAADSADTEKSDFAAAYGELLESSDPLHGLLLAICERDEFRHKMPAEMTAEKQISILELLAGEFGNQISDDDVQLAFAESGIDPDLRVKIVDHSLIRRHGKRYAFTFDFVYDYLRSSILLKWLKGSVNETTVKNVLVACAEQPGNLLDGAADLIRSACGDGWVELARGRFSELRIYKGQQYDDKRQAGFFHVALALVKRDVQRATRVEKLLSVFGDPTSRRFSDLYGRLHR